MKVGLLGLASIMLIACGGGPPDVPPRAGAGAPGHHLAIDQQMVREAPSSWDCSYFDTIIGAPPGVEIRAYEIGHGMSSREGVESRKWTLTNTPRGSYNHIADSEEEFAWACLSGGGKYGIQLRTEKGGSVIETLVEFNLP